MPNISLGSLKFENLPKGVTSMVVLVACVAALAFGYKRYWIDPDLVTAKQSNDLLQASVNEYGRHIAEAPEADVTLLDDIRGKLIAKRYGDDCILVVRIKNGHVHSKLLLDLAKDATHEKSAGPSVLPSMVVNAAGRCVNPHYGAFETWYGKRDGCWVEVWRKWPDGCQHYQMLEACRNYWDTNQDGTPKVRWTTCVH